jgi:hydroxymethylpyrimidine/phosphomethylpyrimidine kinase
MIPVALTIAGSDPSGGAGIQADLKTFHQFGVYGISVVTLVTVQNTCRSGEVEYLRAGLVLAQLDAVLEDLPPQAAKTGALGSREIIEATALRAAQFHFPLVVDPVMIGKQGSPLLTEDAGATLKAKLLPHVYLLTPNIDEAFAIAGENLRRGGGTRSALEDAAKAIAGLGVKNVLIKGGHLPHGANASEAEANDAATDLLYTNGRFETFTAKRTQTRHTHGTGCTFSAAITANLALGKNLFDAVSSAKQFITRAIETNPGLGHGQGPLNHWAKP